MEKFILNAAHPRLDAELIRDYPAHLHINILPEFQGQGIGTTLLHAFLDRLRQCGVPGVHLGTSTLNPVSMKFYEQNGFTLLRESPGDMWETGKECNVKVYGKKVK